MDDEMQAISDRIAKGEYKQQIMPHQHFYQVQVSDKAIVRWCANCGETHMLWPTGSSWTERWTKIWDER